MSLIPRARLARVLLMCDLRAFQRRHQSRCTSLPKVFSAGSLSVKHTLQQTQSLHDLTGINDTIENMSADHQNQLVSASTMSDEGTNTVQKKKKKKKASQEYLRLMELIREIQGFSRRRPRSPFILFLQQCNKQKLQGDLPLRTFFWQCHDKWKLLDAETVAEFVRQATKEREDVLAANVAFGKKCEEVRKLRILIEKKKRRQVLHEVFKRSKSAELLTCTPEGTNMDTGDDQVVHVACQTTLTGVYDDSVPSLETLISDDQLQSKSGDSASGTTDVNDSHIRNHRLNIQVYEDYV